MVALIGFFGFPLVQQIPALARDVLKTASDTEAIAADAKKEYIAAVTELAEVPWSRDVHREVADGPRGHQKHPGDADADGQSDDEEGHGGGILSREP